MILAIETATRVCSVALFQNDRVVALRESTEENAHSRILHQLIDELLKECSININDIKAVAVSKGPGSYTGLRIGVSAAKGMCYAKDIPLISVNTLESMAYGIKNTVPAEENSIIIPMIDARRMEVYTAIFDHELKQIKETAAEIIQPNTFKQYGESKKLYLGGDGAAKCKDVLTGSNIIILEDFNASASHMLLPAMEAYRNNTFENTAYFEPFYLKDFIAGKPKVKGI